MESRFRIVMDFPNKEMADVFTAWWENAGCDQHYDWRENKELPPVSESYNHKTSIVSFKEEEDE